MTDNNEIEASGTTTEEMLSDEQRKAIQAQGAEQEGSDPANETEDVEQVVGRLRDKLHERVVDYATDEHGEGKFYLSSITSKDNLIDILDKIEDSEASSLVSANELNYKFRGKNGKKLLTDPDITSTIKNLISFFPDSDVDELLVSNDPKLLKDGDEVSKVISNWTENIVCKIAKSVSGKLELIGGRGERDSLIITRMKANLIEIENKCRSYYAFIEESREELEGIDGSGIKTVELSDDQLANNLSFREKLLSKILLLDKKKTDQDEENAIHSFVRQAKNPDKFAETGSMNPFDEYELVYAGLILSPESSTRDFLDQISKIYQNLPDNLPEVESVNFILADFEIQRGILKSLAQNLAKSQSMSGKAIMEIGGTSALKTFQQLGAGSESVADAGHSGYSMSYHAGSKDTMIELTNYHNYGEPHTQDLICSSRLFDTGSGIGDIAQPYGPHQDKDTLGEQEMTLIMANLLKDGGFMIHYDGYPPKDTRKIAGVREIYTPKSWATIFRYHQEETKPTDTMSIGKKKVAYKPETKTWELA